MAINTQKVARKSAHDNIKIENLVFDYNELNKLFDHVSKDTSDAFKSQKPKKSLAQVERDKKEIENEASKADIELKKKSLKYLFLFLLFETIIVFSFAFLQGFAHKNFHLEEWTFRLVIAATISQVTYMLQHAIKHLFPKT